MCSYGRQNVVALGKFALNLTGFPRDQGRDLVGPFSRLLSTFVTKVCGEFSYFVSRRQCDFRKRKQNGENEKITNSLTKTKAKTKNDEN